MNTTTCQYEREIVKATKSNQWTTDLQQHASSCPLCQETIAMTTIMNNISSIDAKHPLPSYRLIWLKAQYAHKQERLSVLEMVSLIGMTLTGIAALVGLLLWRFPKLFNGILETTGTSAVSWTSIVSNGTPLAVIIGALIMVWLLTRDSFFAER